MYMIYKITLICYEKLSLRVKEMTAKENSCHSNQKEINTFAFNTYLLYDIIEWNTVGTMEVLMLTDQYTCFVVHDDFKMAYSDILVGLPLHIYYGTNFRILQMTLHLLKYIYYLLYLSFTRIKGCRYNLSLLLSLL